MGKINGMNDAAKKAYEGIQRAVKKQVVKAEDLVTKPAEELLDKEAYMASEKFWNDPHNAAQYSKAMYMLEPKPLPDMRGSIKLGGKPVAEYKVIDFSGDDLAVAVKDLGTEIETVLVHPIESPQKIVVDEVLKDGKSLENKGLSEHQEKLRLKNRIND